MTDKEIYQQIEEYGEESNALYEKIHEQVETSIVKHAQTKKRRKKLFTGILSVAAVFIITLAIVLPIVLKPQDVPDEEIRYSNIDSLSFEKLEFCLKDYYSITNQKLLYLDWYEDAEYLYTARYYAEEKANDTVYLYEKITDENSGSSVEISVMKRNIVIESIEDRFDEFEITNIGNTQIFYVLRKNRSMAKFEYQGYKYYLEIDEERTLNFLVKTIESMFNN